MVGFKPTLPTKLNLEKRIRNWNMFTKLKLDLRFLLIFTSANWSKCKKKAARFQSPESNIYFIIRWRFGRYVATIIHRTHTLILNNWKNQQWNAVVGTQKFFGWRQPLDMAILLSFQDEQNTILYSIYYYRREIIHFVISLEIIIWFTWFILQIMDNSSMNWIIFHKN